MYDVKKKCPVCDKNLFGHKRGEMVTCLQKAGIEIEDDFSWAAQVSTKLGYSLAFRDNQISINGIDWATPVDATHYILYLCILAVPLPITDRESTNEDADTEQ